MPNEWTGTHFVKVYRTLPDDRPDVWDSNDLLAWWLRLLVIASGSYPSSAELPRTVPDAVVDALVDADVIELRGQRFRFHGLGKEFDARMRSSETSIAAGRARAAAAGRDAGGRFTSGAAGSAGNSFGATNGHDPAIAGASDLPAPPLDHPSSHRQTDIDALPPNVGNASISNEPSSGAAGPLVEPWDEPDAVVRSPARPPRVPPGRQPAPGVNPCRSPETHTAEFRYWVGVGWRCPECDAEDDTDAGGSFRDKVRKHGGWTPPQAGETSDDA